MDPPRADLRIGYLCNNNCRFCCVGEQRRFNLTTKQVQEELEVAKKNNAEKVVFTGGEPTVRKDIFDLISYAAKLKFRRILVITNGRMFSYPDFYEKLVECGLTDICFSLPDIRKEIYEHLTQVKGSYEQLMKALELTKKYDLLVSTITTITKLNYEHLPEIAEFLINLRNDMPRIFSEYIFINPTDNAWKNRKELVPMLSDVAPFVHKSLDIARKNNYALNVEAIPLCYMIGYEDHVVELGMAKKRVFMDPEKKADFRYNENRKVLGKIKSKFCDFCPKNNVCEGIWKNYSKIYGVSELRYPEKKGLVGLGTACNQQCVFCTLDKYLKLEIPGFKSKPKTNIRTLEYGPSTEQVKAEIDSMDCTELMFGWPEPTLRPDLKELISYTKEKGISQIIINTNGALLADMDYLKGLQDAGLTGVLVSLHSHIEKVSEEISQTRGHYQRTLKGIKNSIALGLKVNLVHVIFSGNHEVLCDFVNFIDENFREINSINFVFIKPNDSNPENVRHLVPRLSQIKSHLKIASLLCERLGISHTYANIPPCFLSGFEKHNIQTRELLGYESENPFKDWMDDRLKKNEKDEYGYKDKKCSECKAEKYCVGLIKEYAMLYGTKELSPIKNEDWL